MSGSGAESCPVKLGCVFDASYVGLDKIRPLLVFPLIFGVACAFDALGGGRNETGPLMP